MSNCDESVDFYDSMCARRPSEKPITSYCTLGRMILNYINDLNDHYDNIAFVDLTKISYHYVFDDHFQSLINQTYPKFKGKNLKEIVEYFKEQYKQH